MCDIGRKLEDWIYSIIFAIYLGILVGMLHLIGGLDSQSLVSLFVLVFSILVTLMYATASPTVSYEILSGKRVLEELKKRPGIKIGNPEELLFDTRFHIKNLSKFPVRAYVNLNLKLNGEPVKMGDDYCGKKRWHLFPEEVILGHFDISKYIEQIKKDKDSELTMEIEIRNTGIYQYLIRYPIRHFKFDLKKEKWHNKDFGYDV